MKAKSKRRLIYLAIVAVIAAIFVCGFTFFPETTKRVIDTFIDTEDLFGYGETTNPAGVEKDDADNNTAPGTVNIFADMPEGFDYFAIPEWDGTSAYAIINGNIPFFTDEEKETTEIFENYSDLDDLGRCGKAYANICMELMPEEERGDISSVTPSGYKQAKYEGLVDQDYLYNRCHLIAFMLAGENDNPLNLVTGTRYMNVDGMLPWEKSVQQYIYSNFECHVLYRVTPIFLNEELVCRGVLMEGYSLEDGGGLQFCVFAYNVQPGIEISYQNGTPRFRIRP